MSISELRALEGKANPGQWQVDPTEDIGFHHVGSINPLAPICDCEDDEDAAFIAALRNAAPLLLDCAEWVEKNTRHCMSCKQWAWDQRDGGRYKTDLPCTCGLDPLRERLKAL